LIFFSRINFHHQRVIRKSFSRSEKVFEDLLAFEAMGCRKHIKKLNGQFFAAFAAAALQHFLPVARAHSFAKSVARRSSFFLRLVCSFWHIFGNKSLN